MNNALDLSTDVIAAGSALAGLLLVYVGGVVSSFGSYRPEDQSTVLSSYRRRAWIGFSGFFFSLFASALGLLGKWLQSMCMENISLALIFIAFLFAVATALLTVLELDDGSNS